MANWKYSLIIITTVIAVVGARSGWSDQMDVANCVCTGLPVGTRPPLANAHSLVARVPTLMVVVSDYLVYMSDLLPYSMN